MLIVGSEQKGPYLISQLQAMWRAGAVTADTLYWQEGHEEREPISSISKLLDPAPAKHPSSPPAPQIIYTQAPAKQSGCTTIILIALGIVAGVILLSIG